MADVDGLDSIADDCDIEDDAALEDDNEDESQGEAAAVEAQEDTGHAGDNGSGRRGKAKAKGKAATAKAKAPPKSKRYKVVNGLKYCPPCGKWLSVDCFPFGSGQCWDDRLAIQNIQAAAKTQDQLEWWNAVKVSESALAKVVQAYHMRCPKIEGKKRKTIVILSYREEQRQEQQLLLDGVFEMMNAKQYQHWMAKPKNGGIDVEVSRAKFKELCEAPNAVTDQLSETLSFPSDSRSRRQTC